MIAEVIVAVMISQAIAEVTPPPSVGEAIIIVEPTFAEVAQITARFVCQSKTVEVSYLRANLGGKEPRVGSYIERIFVNERPVALHDLQRINSAIDGRVVLGLSQPYCEAGGSAFIPSLNSERPRLGVEEHALAISMYGISQDGSIEPQSIEIRFKGLAIQRIVGDVTQ